MWDRLVDQLRSGDCTPFLGAGACAGTLPLGRDLARQWAEDIGYPFDNPGDLEQVMQYAGILWEDLVSVKQRVARDLSNRGEPAYDQATEPHSLLANLPIKVFLTTNYDDYMTRALQRVGKTPVTAVCPWYRGASIDPGTTLPEAYQPQTDQPLVYHLHGSYRYPGSLVLAEQDYVEFLVNLARDIGEDIPRLLPMPVLMAMTRQPLLFLGYSLSDWSFRMLFHGLVGTVPEVQQRRHISVQLAPRPDAIAATDADTRQRVEQYLNGYFAKLNITVYWGTAEEFCIELRDRLEV